MKRVRSSGSSSSREEVLPFPSHDDRELFNDIAHVKNHLQTTLQSIQGLIESSTELVHNLLCRLDDKISLLNKKQHHIEEMNEIMKRNQEKTKDIIRLNLRGKIFEAHKETLLNVDGSYFYGMLSSGQWFPDYYDAYFIDRPSDGFERILEYLSSGRLSYAGLNAYEIDCVRDNLDYFILSPAPTYDFTSSINFEGHRGKVYALTELRDGRICTGSADCSIKIWNMATQECEKTLMGHLYGVTQVQQLSDGSLCSGSLDSTIKLWDLLRGECIKSLTGSSLIQLSDNLLCVAHYDEMSLWNRVTGVSEKKLRGHTDYIRGVIRLSDRRIASGSSDETVKVWSANTGACDLSIWATSPVLDLVELRSARIACCLQSKCIRILNLITGVCERVLKGHGAPVRSAIVLHDGRLCSGSCDSSVRIWNIDSGDCEKILDDVNAGVRALLQASDGSLCVGLDNNSVKIWK